MKRKINQVVALVTVALLLVQLTPFAAWALPNSPVQDSGTAQTDFDADFEEANTAEEEDDTAEWPKTGARNPDGTPVQQELTPATGESARPESDTVTPQDLAPASYLLTLDLNGGQANGLQGAGWTKQSGAANKWARTVTETAAGEGIELFPDATLGELLPSEPYRAGYKFTGWSLDGSLQTDPLNIQTDTLLQASWEETTYTVTFDDGDPATEDWTISVPYGATLWNEPGGAWETIPEDDWTLVEGTSPAEWTATARIDVGGQSYDDVTVTRRLSSSEGEEARYSYSFTVAGRLYFTYGGAEPLRNEYHFTMWKMTAGGSGYTILQDSVFTAQFEAGRTYVFNVYYYGEDGSRITELSTQTISMKESQIVDGKLTFSTPIPDLEHYNHRAATLTGVTVADSPDVDGNYPVTVDVEQAFGTSDSKTQFLALIILYSPAQIRYTVEYYQQLPTADGYQKVGTLKEQSAAYGSLVPITNRPAELGVSFEGFELSVRSLGAVHEGVTLAEGTQDVEFSANAETATVKIYYDRGGYFVYFQTGTSELQLDALRVLYGAPLLAINDYITQLHRTGYEEVNAADITWYYLDEQGTLQKQDDGAQPSVMPAHDLYAVVGWTPATTAVRIVYWMESRNASGFQNAYTKIVENVQTEAVLTVDLKNATISGDTALTGNVVPDGFNAMIQERYGSLDYTVFFGYSEANTKISPGNVENAQATGTGGVVTDPDSGTSAITQDSFQLVVSGDGTTSINIYYTRNQYTLEFVLAQENAFGNISVATNTPGSFSSSGWTGTGVSADEFVFADFSNPDVVSAAVQETIDGMNVQREYRLKDAVESGDTRSAVGRFGTKTIEGVTCFVYTLTARFEAEIVKLWPTNDNLKKTLGGYAYISMGTDQYSFYRQVYAVNSVSDGNVQANILNAYSTMDLNVLGMYNGPIADPKNWPFPNIAPHQMVAYWKLGGANEYTYYFLYETLDTTVTADLAAVEDFVPQKADAGLYADGTLVKWNDKIYLFDTANTSVQLSGSTKRGQNQPARHGYVSEGRTYFGNDGDAGGNIYFFYSREVFTLDLQNTNGSYDIPPEMLTTEFECLEQYGADTLRQLGWEGVGTDGKAQIRYGGQLSIMNEPEIIAWLTDEARGDEQMKYPLPSTGENKYYFSHWYRNAIQTVIVDWRDNEMKTAQSSITLYAGWFTPRYTTTYVLNGGVWTDQISYTLIATSLEQENLFLYYPHQTQDEDATVYWYLQSRQDDRLYVDNLYSCRIGDVLEWEPTVGHWKLRDGVTPEDFRNASELDLTGTRLVDRYFCYMGSGLDPSDNHEVYVSINAELNGVLPEPMQPTRSGYDFAGWFYFDDVANGTIVRLEEVLAGNEGLAAYSAGSVYVDSTGDAYLLHEMDGELIYYKEQLGYRFSYANEASVVSQSRQLYAAWRSTSDAKLTAYHLLKTDEVEEGYVFSPQSGGGGFVEIGDSTQTIEIGGEKYYILKTEQRDQLFTGSTQTLFAEQYYTDGQSKKWLPEQATIPLRIDDSTQTVNAPTEVTEGNTYRIENTGEDAGTYTYYAFFVYGSTDRLTYNVYAIDLATAVAQGALKNYSDTFARDDPPDRNEPYVLKMEEKDWSAEDETAAIAAETAPAISGYTVYETSSALLQLQTQAGTNNIYFYYVRDGSFVEYTVNFYLMKDGSYSSDDRLTFTGIPAVVGEFLSLRDMKATGDLLLTQAETYSGYRDSTDVDKKLLYQRYRTMTATLTQNGVSRSFTVDTDAVDTLQPSEARTLLQDYYFATCSPTGEVLVASDGAEIDVYLAMAELTVNKVNSDGDALNGAEFILECLVLDPQGSVLYEGQRYRVEESFGTLTAVSGADGRTLFRNLSAAVRDDVVYRLTETKAPPGYTKLQDPVYVRVPYVVDGTPSYQVRYTVSNAGISYLPKAGAFGGVYTTIFLGGGMMTSAIGYGVLLASQKRRRKNKEK